MKFILVLITVLSFNSGVWALGLLEDCPLLRQMTFNKPMQRPPAKTIIFVSGAGIQEHDVYFGPLYLGKSYESYSSVAREQRISFIVQPVPGKNHGIETRAALLIQTIKNLSPRAFPVLLIGHSFGGVVARRAAVNPEVAPLISAVVTVSSPNWGSPLADYFSAESGSQGSRIARRIHQRASKDKSRPDYLFDIRQSNMREFNAKIETMDQGVPVFSVVTILPSFIKQYYINKYSIPTFTLLDETIRHMMTTEPEVWGKANDGLVPAANQLYGECLGVVRLDHGVIVGVSFPQVDVYIPEAKGWIPDVPRSLSRQVFREMLQRLRERNVLAR